MSEIPHGWRRATLGEFLSFQRGHDLPQPRRRPGTVPVVGSGGVIGWHDEAIAKGPGVTIGRAANLGVPTLVHDDYWPLNTTLYVTDFCGNNVRFCYYLLKTIDLTGFNSGSVQPMLNRNYIRGFSIVVPSHSEQQAISDMLGVLDDKIEVNERIAATAWRLSSALLSVDRWPRRAALGDLASLAQVRGNPGELGSASRVAHFSLPAFDNDQAPEIGSPMLIKSAKTLIDQPVVLLSKLNPRIPRIWHVVMVGKLQSFASTEFLALVPKAGISTSDLAAVCRQPSFHEALVMKASGTSNSHQRIRPQDVLRTEVIDPRQCDPQVRSMLILLERKAWSVRKESLTLAELRDALLPRLISGELRVRDAEKAVEDAI